MIDFQKLGVKDIAPLRKISIQTFLESHGHSAAEEDVSIYQRYAFAQKKLEEELLDSENLFYGLIKGHEMIGYSKIILNKPYSKKMSIDSCKMERIYILKEYYGSGLGQDLFDFNIKLTKENKQSNLWLYTWIENKRAVQFYLKNGFKIIDRADFKLSSNHSNPNYIMLLNI